MSTENFTQITLQQLVNLETSPISASKYPKYVVNLGYSISNITATELAGAIESTQASAAAAKVSETNAKTSETNAASSATKAKASEVAAALSETNAKSSETAAKTSETNAKTSETNTKTSETNAKSSETAAKTSETNAKTSETNAKASETKALASETAAKTSETNAKTSETNAKASETAAFTSKNAAKASEDAALLSKNAAASSETKAKTSETNAKASETAAKTSETNAKASETSATASKNAAKTSETNAKASETASKTSETNAKASETAAKTSETNAKTSADFAEAQADRAEDIKNTLPSKEQFVGTVKVYDTYQEALDDLEWRDIDEKVVVWSESDSTYGWYTVTSTNNVKSLTLDRKEKKVKTINSISPDSQGNVKLPYITKVNGVGVTESSSEIKLPYVSNINSLLPDENGNITLPYAKLGANNDITNLLALAGPLRLGGDAAADNQAVTLRQLISAVAGAGGNNGATLNGVMNNFLGAVEWFNGTRAAIVAGHLPADGQLLKRADYPELWNAINTGLLKSTTESAWQTADGWSRGLYSTGDGSTTFRLPDLNGAQTNSVASVVLRGNAGTAAAIAMHGDTGSVRLNAAPNITGQINLHGAQSDPNQGATVIAGASGSMVPQTQQNNWPNLVSQYASGSLSYASVAFDASRSHPSYGRNSTAEIRMNSVVGIWLIRVNGKFSASDTNFNVINSVATVPSAGGVAYGGDVRSVLQVNGTDYLTSRVRTRLVVGKEKVLELGLVDTSGSTVVTSPTVDVISDGSIATTASIRFRTPTKSQELNLGFRTGSESEVIINYTNGVSALNFNNLAGTGFGSVYSNGQVTGTDLIAYGTLYARGIAPLNPSNGTFLSSPSVRSYLWGRGGYSDPNGAYFGFYHQENVGSYARGVMELNGYGSNRNWIFSNDGSLAGPGGIIQGAASDIRLKFDIKPAKEGAGDRIDSLGVVEYTYGDTGSIQRGFLSQQADTVDELYTSFGGENETTEGEKFEILNLNDRAVLADVVAALQEARATIKELTSRLDQLESK